MSGAYLVSQLISSHLMCWAYKNEMIDRLDGRISILLSCTLLAFISVRLVDSVEVPVEREVSTSYLQNDTGLLSG